jgi:hypothetical protein
MTKFHERQPDGTWVEKDEPLVTKTGKVLTEAQIRAFAEEAEQGYGTQEVTDGR